MSELIYSCADVAQLLRVTKQAVSNYRARYDDTPEPAYITTDGRLYWTVAGVQAWMRWKTNLMNQRPKTKRSMQAYQTVEKLRQSLS